VRSDASPIRPAYYGESSREREYDRRERHPDIPPWTLHGDRSPERDRMSLRSRSYVGGVRGNEGWQRPDRENRRPSHSVWLSLLGGADCCTGCSVGRLSAVEHSGKYIFGAPGVGLNHSAGAMNGDKWQPNGTIACVRGGMRDRAAQICHDCTRNHANPLQRGARGAYRQTRALHRVERALALCTLVVRKRTCQI
jgi:hypothetical protein